MNEQGKILVVDDDAIVRKMLIHVLTNAGYDVIEASSGNEAIRKIVVNKPDLILLDLLMPDIDGFKVCHMVRNELNSLATPIIFLTASDNKEDILKGLEVGANDYIVKPVEPFELQTRVKSHLRLKGLYDDATAEKRDLMALLEISQAVSSTLSSIEILDTIVQKVAEVIDVARCSIVRIGKKEGVGHVLTTYENPNIKNLPIDLDKYPELKKALIKKDTVIIDDIYNDPLLAEVRDYLKDLEFSSLLVVPIVIRAEAVGILFLRTSRRASSFTQRETKLCKVIANLSGNALMNAHLFESMELSNLELEKLAMTDGLTGAYNHRHFRKMLDDEFNRSRRYEDPLSCIMLDIDYFKNINDAFGHAQGDIVLKEITDVIKENVRQTDIVARYGGEEFVILLPQTTREGAFVEAERIRKAIKSYRCSGRDQCIMVTVSMGVATFPAQDILKADDLVGFADNALYEAKANGRDRTVEHRPLAIES